MLVAEKRFTLTDLGFKFADFDKYNCWDYHESGGGKTTAKKCLEHEGGVYVCKGRTGINGAQMWHFVPLLTHNEFKEQYPHVNTYDRHEDVPNYAVGRGTGELCAERQATVGHDCGILISYKKKPYRLGAEPDGIVVVTDDWDEKKKDDDDWKAAGEPTWWIWMGDVWSDGWTTPARSRHEKEIREKFAHYVKRGHLDDYGWMQKGKPLPPVVLLDPDGNIVDAHFPADIDRKKMVADMNYFMGWKAWTSEMQAAFIERLGEVDAATQPVNPDGWPNPTPDAAEQLGHGAFDISHDETLNELKGMAEAYAVACEILKSGNDPETNKPWNKSRASQSRKEQCDQAIVEIPQSIDSILAEYYGVFGANGLRIMCERAAMKYPEWASAPAPETVTRKAVQLSLFDIVLPEPRIEQLWLF